MTHPGKLALDAMVKHYPDGTVQSVAVYVADLEAQLADARWLLQTADECLHHDHPSKLIAQWLKETGPKVEA